MGLTPLISPSLTDGSSLGWQSRTEPYSNSRDWNALNAKPHLVQYSDDINHINHITVSSVTGEGHVINRCLVFKRNSPCNSFLDVFLMMLPKMSVNAIEAFFKLFNQKYYIWFRMFSKPIGGKKVLPLTEYYSMDWTGWKQRRLQCLLGLLHPLLPDLFFLYILYCRQKRRLQIYKQYLDW